MKKFTTVAATLAMMLVAAVPAYAQDASTGDVHDNSVDDESFVLAGDGSQVALNDSSQSLDQTAYQYNSPVATISGNGNEVAQGGNDVNAEQTQYSFNLLYGFNDANFNGIDDSFDHFVLFGGSNNNGIDDGSGFGNVRGANAIIAE